MKITGGKKRKRKEKSTYADHLHWDPAKKAVFGKEPRPCVNEIHLLILICWRGKSKVTHPTTPLLLSQKGQQVGVPSISWPPKSSRHTQPIKSDAIWVLGSGGQGVSFFCAHGPKRIKETPQEMTRSNARLNGKVHNLNKATIQEQDRAVSLNT